MIKNIDFINGKNINDIIINLSKHGYVHEKNYPCALDDEFKDINWDIMTIIENNCEPVKSHDIFEMQFSRNYFHNRHMFLFNIFNKETPTTFASYFLIHHYPTLDEMSLFIASNDYETIKFYAKLLV
jgi:hypothetical protein